MPAIKGTSSIASSVARDKLLRTTKFPKSFYGDRTVYASKINIPILSLWIDQRILKILGFEDEIVASTVKNFFFPNGNCNGPNIPIRASSDHHQQQQQQQQQGIQIDPRLIQLDISGFLGNEEAAQFCEELWDMILDAQSRPHGIPQRLIDEKKAQLAKEQQEQVKQRQDRHSVHTQDSKKNHPMNHHFMNGNRNENYSGGQDSNSLRRVATQRAEAARMSFLDPRSQGQQLQLHSSSHSSYFPSHSSSHSSSYSQSYSHNAGPNRRQDMNHEKNQTWSQHYIPPDSHHHHHYRSIEKQYHSHPNDYERTHNNNNNKRMMERSSSNQGLSMERFTTNDGDSMNHHSRTHWKDRNGDSSFRRSKSKDHDERQEQDDRTTSTSSESSSRNQNDTNADETSRKNRHLSFHPPKKRIRKNSTSTSSSSSSSSFISSSSSSSASSSSSSSFSSSSSLDHSRKRSTQSFDETSQDTSHSSDHESSYLHHRSSHNHRERNVDKRDVDKRQHLGRHHRRRHDRSTKRSHEIQPSSDPVIRNRSKQDSSKNASPYRKQENTTHEENDSASFMETKRDSDVHVRRKRIPKEPTTSGNHTGSKEKSERSHDKHPKKHPSSLVHS